MIPWRDLFRIFGRIGLLSFGGPAAQIALMHRVLVDEQKWLEEKDYLRALSFCMLLPGPEAMQLATYAGWRLRGVPGGLLAGLLFVLPGALVILALTLLYAAFGTLPFTSALFLGVKAAVVVVVIEALLRVSKRALKGRVHYLIAALAFVALFFFRLPFPLVILIAGLFGFATTSAKAAPAPTGRARPLWGTTAVLMTLWAAPLLWAWAADATFLLDLGLFFSKLAVVTFGGAYAVLSYMTAEVVQTKGWLTTPEMMDALGLAETTPGPLILVTEFVGALAGLKQGGWGLGLASAAMVLWVTFVPCFLWIFAGAPYIDRLAGNPRLTGALAAITAAVVGVIGNLSVWFGLHVLFRAMSEQKVGWLHLPTPEISSLDPLVLALIGLAGWLLLKRHWGIGPVLALSAALSLIASLALTAG